MIQTIINLLGITDERYIHYAYECAVILVPLCVVLVWDMLWSIFKNFTRFK